MLQVEVENDVIVFIPPRPGKGTLCLADAATSSRVVAARHVGIDAVVLLEFAALGLFCGTGHDDGPGFLLLMTGIALAFEDSGKGKHQYDDSAGLRNIIYAIISPTMMIAATLPIITPV